MSTSRRLHAALIAITLFTILAVLLATPCAAETFYCFQRFAHDDDISPCEKTQPAFLGAWRRALGPDADCETRDVNNGCVATICTRSRAGGVVLVCCDEEDVCKKLRHVAQKTPLG